MLLLKTSLITDLKSSSLKVNRNQKVRFVEVLGSTLLYRLNFQDLKGFLYSSILFDIKDGL